MHRWHVVAVLVCTALAPGLLGCPSGRGAADAGTPAVEYPREALDVRCTNTQFAERHLALGANEDVFYISQSGERTSRGLVTRDRGRTFSVIPTECTTGSGLIGTTYQPLGGSDTLMVVDEDFWGFHGSSAPFSDTTYYDTQGNPLYVTLVLGGQGREVAPEVLALPLPDGSSTQRVWKRNATHWMARNDWWLWGRRTRGPTGCARGSFPCNTGRARAAASSWRASTGRASAPSFTT